jgi:polyisoprenoid-binding protein YceI
MVFTMKKYWNGQLLLTFTMMLTCIYQARAQSGFTVKSMNASVSGGSSLHDWESAITKTIFKGQMISEGKIIKSIKNIEVKVAVKSIKSKEGRVMDKKTYEAFKSDANPYITYACMNAIVTIDASKSVVITGDGKLSMAGVTKPISLVAKGKLQANGDLQLTVSKSLVMTDYGMKPPKAVLGTITVKDEVTIQFDMVLTPTKMIAKKTVK